MSGANIMCPGLTSPGGRLPDDLNVNAIVVRILTQIYESVLNLL